MFYDVSTREQLRAVRRDLADAIREQSILEEALTVIGRQTTILVGRAAQARERFVNLEAELAAIEQHLADNQKQPKHPLNALHT